MAFLFIMARKFYNESEIKFSEYPKSPKFIIHTEKKFGRLVVIGFAGQGESWLSTWFCKCECGKIIKANGSNLIKGNTLSCGCLKLEKIKEATTTHGHSKNGHTSPEYNTWANMFSRTQNPKNTSFMDYGGRGITLCERWLKFENFLADMGEKPGKNYSIDRIENDLGYYKENCRWATPQEQADNKRSNILLTYNGKTQNITQWENELGTNRGTLWMRLKLGWSVEKALTMPTKNYRKS